MKTTFRFRLKTLSAAALIATGLLAESAMAQNAKQFVPSGTLSDLPIALPRAEDRSAPQPFSIAIDLVGPTTASGDLLYAVVATFGNVPVCQVPVAVIPSELLNPLPLEGNNRDSEVVKAYRLKAVTRFPGTCSNSTKTTSYKVVLEPNLKVSSARALPTQVRLMSQGVRLIQTRVVSP